MPRPTSRALVAAALFSVASAHGYLTIPEPRQTGDMSGHQDDPGAGPCKSLPRGTVLTAYRPGESVTHSWLITLVHTPGFCSLRWALTDAELSYDGSTGTLSPFGYHPYGGSSSAPAQFGYTGQRVDSESGVGERRHAA